MQRKTAVGHAERLTNRVLTKPHVRLEQNNFTSQKLSSKHAKGDNIIFYVNETALEISLAIRITNDSLRLEI